jgi:dTDP-3-amino-3,4,6-trideoxy-alpha-D-glucose transaminase
VNPIPFLDLRSILASDRAGLIDAFTRVLDSGRFVLGAELEQFEAEFAAWCGARYAIGVGNGLDALYLSLEALGVGPGDEVVVPAHTFVATWLAVTRCGATPVAVEPDPSTCLVTAETVEMALTARTKAVVAVHLYGAIQGIDAIASLCARRGIPLLEDAAQAHGARLGGVRAGNHGVAGCFSFYPSKNLGACGDAGAVVTSDDQLRDKLVALRNYGSRQRYAHELAGTNSRLDEVQAAWLRVRLAHTEVENARRQDIAARYLERLSGAPGVLLPSAGAPGSHVWHLFVVQTDGRDALQRFLAQRGIETLIHYPRPVYRFPPFAAFAPHGATIADRVTARVLSLPMGPHLSDGDVHRVCDTVLAFADSAGGGPRA